MVHYTGIERAREGDRGREGGEWRKKGERGSGSPSGNLLSPAVLRTECCSAMLLVYTVVICNVLVCTCIMIFFGCTYVHVYIPEIQIVK